MGFALSKEEVDRLKVDTYIVERIRSALTQLKQCRTEEERVDYHTVLGALAPTRAAARDSEGMIRAVSERLGIERGARYVLGGEKRPYAFDQAITRRAHYDGEVERAGPLRPGDAATSRGQKCVVVDINYEADTCTLCFGTCGVEAQHSYTCIYKGVNPPRRAPFPKGSARLRRAPPSLRPKPREMRRDAVAEVASPKVKEIYESEGARSPAQRDSVRRRVGRYLYESAQALIVYATTSSLYKLFRERHPEHADLSLTTFRSLRPWYVRRAREETCLCKSCENFKQQMRTLRTVADTLQPLMEQSPTADADDGAGADEEDQSRASEWEGADKLRRLISFCRLESKSSMVKAYLCDGAFDRGGEKLCLEGKCLHCGFKNLWSNGLRQHIVDSKGDVLRTAPVEFQSIVKWTRIKSSKQKTPEEGKDTRYDAKTGTIVQFLDEFERETCPKFPHHRFTIKRQKEMDAQFNRNRWPGWIQMDIDFAMDGTIPPPQGRSMQSDHWSPMSYTLCPIIVSWLCSDIWTSRNSQLKKGDAVTVEPPEFSQPGTVLPPAGSYWADVVSLPADNLDLNHELCVYGVRRHGSPRDAPLEMVQRQLLRHRKLRTEAFVHLSDDKTHDSWAAQVMISKTLEYLDQHFVQTGGTAGC